MLLPDPNNLTGDVRITHAASMEKLLAEPEWTIVSATGIVAGRGIGALELARQLRSPAASTRFRF
jgi:hypothetical protein